MNFTDITICFIAGTLIGFVLITMYALSDLRDKVNNIQPIINEQICEELLPYRFRGRQEFVCYKGEEIEYTNREQYIIDQWKDYN